MLYFCFHCELRCMFYLIASFLNQCRPLSVSMGNAIKYLKHQISMIPSDFTDSQVGQIVKYLYSFFKIDYEVFVYLTSFCCLYLWLAMFVHSIVIFKLTYWHNGFYWLYLWLAMFTHSIAYFQSNILTGWPVGSMPKITASVYDGLSGKAFSRNQPVASLTHTITLHYVFLEWPQ